MEINIELTADVTEYAVISKILNTKNVFNIQKNCIVISFCDDNGNVLSQSEISITDARILAQYINKLF